jgi:hypothetical protein
MRRLLGWTLGLACLALGLTGCSGNKGIDLRADQTVPFIAGKDPEPIAAGGSTGKKDNKPMQKWQGGTDAAKPAPAPTTPPPK